MFSSCLTQVTSQAKLRTDSMFSLYVLHVCMKQTKKEQNGLSLLLSDTEILTVYARTFLFYLKRYTDRKHIRYIQNKCSTKGLFLTGINVALYMSFLILFLIQLPVYFSVLYLVCALNSDRDNVQENVANIKMSQCSLSKGFLCV